MAESERTKQGGQEMPKATGEYGEPWFMHGDGIYTGPATIHDPGYMTLHSDDTFQVLSLDIDMMDRDEEWADAVLLRACQCVNACEGIPDPSQLRKQRDELREALIEVMAESIDDYYHEHDTDGVLERARAALSNSDTEGE